MFPAPLIAATIWSFTVSIIPEFVVFIFNFISFCDGNVRSDWAGRRVFGARTSQQPYVRVRYFDAAVTSMVILLITLVTPWMSVASLVTRLFSAGFLATPLTVTTPSV